MFGGEDVAKNEIIGRYLNQKIELAGSQKSFDYELIQYKNHLFKIWDSAGQERFNTLTKNTLRNTDGLIVLFDLCKKSSFIQSCERINAFMQQLGEPIPIVLVGDKRHKRLQRDLSKEEALDFAQSK